VPIDATRIAMEKPLTRTTVLVRTTTSYAIARLSTNVHIQHHANSPWSRYFPDEHINMLQNIFYGVKCKCPCPLINRGGIIAVVGKAHRGGVLEVIPKWALPHAYPDSIRE
jgi:hypothetical protein